MAIANMSIDDQTGEKPGAPVFFINVSFDGDDAYPAGGTLALQAAVRAAMPLGQAVEIMAIIPGDCGGYVPAYIKSTGALIVYQGDNANVADGPLTEVPDPTDLSAVTFNITCICR